MFLRKSPTERIESVARSKVETGLAYFEGQLLLLHKEFFRGLLSKHVERVKLEVPEQEYAFESRYPFALGKIGARAFAATEAARHKHGLDQMMIARAVGAVLFQRAQEERLAVANTVFEDAGRIIRADVDTLSYGQLFAATVMNTGNIYKPAARYKHSPDRHNPASHFIGNFDINRASGDVINGVSTSDPVGMLRLTLDQITNPTLVGEAVAFDACLEELKAKTMPTPAI